MSPIYYSAPKDRRFQAGLEPPCMHVRGGPSRYWLLIERFDNYFIQTQNQNNKGSTFNYLGGGGEIEIFRAAFLISQRFL